QSQDVLQRALAEYPGSYCIVSHNRQFLDPIVNKVLEFRPGYAPRLFYGNVSQYIESVEAEERRLKAAANNATTAATVQSPATPANKKDARRARAQEREKRARVLKPLQLKLAQVEEEIAAKDARREEISAELEKPENVSDNQVLMTLTQEYQQLERETETLYSRWEEISVEIEQAEAALNEEFGASAEM
ncbi:MAG: ABC transporter ATP-binding protein, partial [Akkermansia sp.]|nr:ABC transporter ATP-binding protein [Akkermansia sp.]